MAFRKRRHRGPCALEVINLNAVASNLPRTCSKSQSLPNSVIFITELHLHVFLALCSSSNSEPDGGLQRREVPDRLWITKITYLIVGTNKLQRILPRTLLFTDLNQFLIQPRLHFPAARVLSTGGSRGEASPPKRLSFPPKKSFTEKKN